MTATTFSIRPERTVHPTCPHDCPDTCAMLVTVHCGVATQVRGDPAHPTTQGVLCSTVSRTPARTYSADRVLHPRRRVGPKGTPAIAIDPYRSLAAEKSDWHLAPGTRHRSPAPKRHWRSG